MKDRPILFSAPMVRAILDGRKTQTRRKVKLNCAGRVDETAPKGRRRNWHLDDPNCVLACPYGQPGDRLWVRETFMPFVGKCANGDCLYRATYEGNDAKAIRWTPSIFMPRAASRITLGIVAVRVERLNEISEADAMAEGVEWKEYAGLSSKTARKLYADLWQSINGPGSWVVNPWVWVLTFKRIQAP